MVQDVLLLEVHLGGEAVQLSFHLCTDAAIQSDPCQSQTRRYGSRNGLNYWLWFLFIRHDWSCIARSAWGWIVSMKKKMEGNDLSHM
jgi:hypothetical protein